MTELAADPFTRGDNADLGANWTPLEDTFKIVSNTAQPNNSLNDAVEVYDGGITWPDNQYSEVDVNSGGSEGVGSGVVVRGAGTSWYRIVARINATLTIEVAKFNPSYTKLGSTIDVAWAANDRLKTEIDGSTLTIYKNGTSVGTRTDTAITSGKPGITNSGPSSTPILDNWAGGSIDAAPAPTLSLIPPMVIGG